MDTCVCPSLHVWTETKKHTSYDHLCPSAHVWTVRSYKTPLLWLFFWYSWYFCGYFAYLQPHKTDSHTGKKTPKFMDKSSHKTPFCGSVRPSVRPKPEIPSFDLYLGPLVHPTNRDRFTACPSVRPSVCPSVRLSVRRGFRAFAGECMKRMAWNFTCWCILTIFRTDKFMAMVCWFFKFWHYFDLVKRIKFGVSGHFLKNAWREWPEILHADVSWPSSELISLWLWSVDFSNFSIILT